MIVYCNLSIRSGGRGIARAPPDEIDVRDWSNPPRRLYGSTPYPHSLQPSLPFQTFLTLLVSEFD